MYKAIVALMLVVGLGWTCATTYADPPRPPKDFVWKGGNGDWENPNNWEPAGVPGENTKDTVTVPAGVAKGTITITKAGEKKLKKFDLKNREEGNGVTIAAGQAGGVTVYDIKIVVTEGDLYVGTHNEVRAGNGDAAHPAGGHVTLSTTGVANDTRNFGTVQGGNGANGEAGAADGGPGGNALLQSRDGVENRGLVRGGRGGDGLGVGKGGDGGHAKLNGRFSWNLTKVATLLGGDGGDAGNAGGAGGKGGDARMVAGAGGWQNQGTEKGGKGGDAVAGQGGDGGRADNSGRRGGGMVKARGGQKKHGDNGVGAAPGRRGDARARAGQGVELIGPGPGGRDALDEAPDDQMTGDIVVVHCDPAGEILLDGLSPYAIQADTEVYLIAGHDGVIVLQNMEPGVVVIDAPVVYACGLVLSPDELTLEDLCPPDTEIYYERGACTPPPNPHLGDMNCDNAVDFKDINPFVLAVTDMMAYMEAYPGCDWLNGDINDDGWTDFGDINPFVTLLLGQ